ncbi:MAG: dihydrofolate reductase [Chloroflexi bacterium]|nr:MAG: dihydrofolate reductase [Chloroflexota bacterium]
MRKVLAFNLISLDGCFEGPDHNIDWHTVDDEFNDFAVQQLADLGMLIFGRVTYDLMASYWPTPAAIESDPHVANQMNALPKIVFSRTRQTVDWTNTRLVSTDAGAEVATLKTQPGKDIALFGSAKLQSSLLQAGQIDELRVMVNPVILGRGTPLFKPEDHLKLSLLDMKRFRSGNVLLTFAPRQTT